MSINGTSCRKVAVLAVISLVGLLATGCTHPATQTREDRVNAAFAGDAEAIQQKEGVPSAPTAHRLVGTAELADRTQVSLWVSDPGADTGIRSSCWYLDVETPSRGAGGTGSCGMPTTTVVLNRQDEIVIGSVGTWKAPSVRVETPVATAELPVTGSYFLVPPSVAGTAQSTFTITLLDASAQPIGVVRGLTAPGTATPAP